MFSPLHLECVNWPDRGRQRNNSSSWCRSCSSWPCRTGPRAGGSGGCRGRGAAAAAGQSPCLPAGSLAHSCSSAGPGCLRTGSDSYIKETTSSVPHQTATSGKQQPPYRIRQLHQGNNSLRTVSDSYIRGTTASVSYQIVTSGEQQPPYRIR